MNDLNIRCKLVREWEQLEQLEKFYFQLKEPEKREREYMNNLKSVILLNNFLRSKIIKY